MAKHVKRGIVLAVALAACQNSFAPDPAIIGTWNVTFDTLSKGALNPSSLAVTVGQGSSGYTATIPNLTWDEPAAGGAVFDSAPAVAVQGNTILFRLFVGSTNNESCKLVLFGGQFNAAKDSVPAGEADVYDAALDMTATCFARGGVVLDKQ